MEDAALVRAVLQGDLEAYGGLMLRHQAGLQRLCARLSGNDADAAELAHDALVEGYLKLRQLREPARFGPWLRSIALNLFRMGLRRERREEALDLNSVAAPTPPPEMPANLDRVLARLSPNHRLILVLHYYERMPYEAIAAFLGVPPGTVMSRLHRARQAVRADLEEEVMDNQPLDAEATDIREEVYAEIAVLMEMFGEDREAAERLSALLKRSPESLAELIRRSDGPVVLQPLAVLVPRLGDMGMALLVAGALSDEEPLAWRCASILYDGLNHFRAPRRQSFVHGFASRESYDLAWHVLQSGAAQEAKARLLLAILEEVTRDCDKAFFGSLLLCMPDVACRLLADHFQASDAGNSCQSAVMTALCRMPERTGPLALECLKGDTASQRRGLTLLAWGTEPVWLEDARPERYHHELRSRPSFAAWRPEDFPCEMLAALQARCTELLDSKSPEVQELAVTALANLGTKDAAGALARLLDDAPERVCCSILRALV